MTDEEISNLTDEQINVMVTSSVLNINEYKVSETGKTICHAEGRDMCVITVKDYCNDPAVMWPIIVENEISIIKEENKAVHFACMSEWDGWELNMRLDTYHQNPLRAAAIVYLKIKGVL